MRVRLVENDDFEDIAAILRPYVERTAIHFAAAAPTADELRAEWHAARAQYATLVADVDGAIAGFAKAGVFRTRAAYRWSAEVGVYVAEQHQRRGVARALYERLIAVCRAQGFHLLVAGIALPNDASVKLHEAFGFAHAGTFREVGFKLGRFHDVGFWTLALSSSERAPSPLLAPSEVA